jgi:hypothetical protein
MKLTRENIRKSIESCFYGGDPTLKVSEEQVDSYIKFLKSLNIEIEEEDAGYKIEFKENDIPIDRPEGMTEEEHKKAWEKGIKDFAEKNGPALVNIVENLDFVKKVEVVEDEDCLAKARECSKVADRINKNSDIDGKLYHLYGSIDYYEKYIKQIKDKKKPRWSQEVEDYYNQEEKELGYWEKARKLWIEREIALYRYKGKDVPILFADDVDKLVDEYEKGIKQITKDDNERAVILIEESAFVPDEALTEDAIKLKRRILKVMKQLKEKK